MQYTQRLFSTDKKWLNLQVINPSYFSSFTEIYGEVSFSESNRQLFTFDISSIPEGSEVIMAELKVYKERPNHSIFKPDGETHIVNHGHVHSALVSVNQLTNEEIDLDADPTDLAADVVNQHNGMITNTIDQRLVS